MGGPTFSSINATDLQARIGTAGAPAVFDVRRAAAYEAGETLVVGALRRDPQTLATWLHDVPRDRPVVVYCVHGHEVSQGIAGALRAVGHNARYLEGGIAGWAEQGLPRRKKLTDEPHSWITRERPKIDRIACPWLIRRFVDPEAQFLFAPTEQVFDIGRTAGAMPYDIPGSEPFSHDGELCSFDAFIRCYGIADPALDALAVIVRGADTARLEIAPQSAGLLAFSLGLSANFPDDHDMLEQGIVMYDALYAWCRSCQTETHNWTPGERA